MYLLAICHLSSLKKKSVWAFLPFFNWVVCFLILNCVSCLYILDINPLSVISFTDSFSHSLNCWFTKQKLLCLIRSHLFIFAFVFISLGDRSKKILLWFMPKNFPPMFSSSSFMVSSLIFRFLTGSWWWTGKPGVLQSMESQRVGRDWATELRRVLYLGLWST